MKNENFLRAKRLLTTESTEHTEKNIFYLKSKSEYFLRDCFARISQILRAVMK